jgi:hypothetical protein
MFIRDYVSGPSWDAVETAFTPGRPRTFARPLSKIEEKSAGLEDVCLWHSTHKSGAGAVFAYRFHMSVPEKLRVMEALWDDLSRNSKPFQSPRWHQAALKERKKRIASGRTSYMDWERAKKEIRRRVA